VRDKMAQLSLDKSSSSVGIFMQAKTLIFWAQI